MGGSRFHPGQDIGGFVILKPLGKGGMAELFIARDRVLRRRVVVKVLNPVLSKRKGLRRQFLREARIQAGLDNPRIVQVLQGLEEGENLCLVMQYVQGTDLEKVIKKARGLREKKGAQGALSVERSVHIFLQVLEGIGFAHKYRIIHGDIKPSNILLDRQGRAKVADFGLAFLMRYERGHEEWSFHGGTPYYMSPEQVLNQGVDLRSDIYALGVTFFHMITGGFPFGKKKRFMELVECHMEGSLDEAREAFAKCGETPLRIKDAIFKALENDPEKRHQSCLEFALAIQQETSHEMYSELLRLSLLGKKEITPSERAYLDEIAAKKSLSREEAQSLEENIRNEVGLPPLDFHREFKAGLEDLLRRGREGRRAFNELKKLYVAKKRLSREQAAEVMDRVLLKTDSSPVRW